MPRTRDACAVGIEDVVGFTGNDCGCVNVSDERKRIMIGSKCGYKQGDCEEEEWRTKKRLHFVLKYTSIFD